MSAKRGPEDTLNILDHQWSRAFRPRVFSFQFLGCALVSPGLRSDEGGSRPGFLDMLLHVFAKRLARAGEIAEFSHAQLIWTEASADRACNRSKSAIFRHVLTTLEVGHTRTASLLAWDIATLDHILGDKAARGVGQGDATRWTRVGMETGAALRADDVPCSKPSWLCRAA